MNGPAALEALRAAAAEGRYIQFANTNPHWWVTHNSGKFIFTYECCDLPECHNSETDEYDSLEALLSEHAGDFCDGEEWVEVYPVFR